MKILTFSYDDGVTQDRRLVEMLNRYGLKATFNLNSGLLGKPGELEIEGKKISHVKVEKEEVRQLYAGHEVAVHTLTHPNLTQLPPEEVIRQVEEDRKELSRLAGYEVHGMAYPCGGVNNDDRTAKIIAENTGVRYARTIQSTFSFDPCRNLYRFDPTIHHIRDLNKTFELADEFISLDSGDETKLFYIWGHSYEFDVNDTWGQFEELCRMLSGRPDINYCTNEEAFANGVIK